MLLRSTTVLALFAVATAELVRRLGRAADVERTTLAALGGVMVAFLVGAAIDWIWQLTAVAGVAIVAVALLTGPPGGLTSAPARQPASGASTNKIGVWAASIAVAWVLVCAQAVPWVGARRIAQSQAAARHGDLVTAARFNPGVLNDLDDGLRERIAAAAHIR